MVDILTIEITLHLFWDLFLRCFIFFALSFSTLPSHTFIFILGPLRSGCTPRVRSSRKGSFDVHRQRR